MVNADFDFAACFNQVTGNGSDISCGDFLSINLGHIIVSATGNKSCGVS